MSGIGHVLRKDLRIGPRSPLVLWAIVLPLVMTFLIRGIFGGLFESAPRLGIVDYGNSEITAQALELEGLDTRLLGDENVLLAQVEANDLDGGLILPAGFDAAIRAGDKPELQLFVGGESLASDRVVIAVTAIDLIRGVAGDAPPVDVLVVSLGEESLELSLRLLPLIVVYAVAIAGAVVPAMSLVEEKERGTINAVLVTPVTVHGFQTAKAMFGIVLALATGIMTLLINDAFGAVPLATILALTIGAVMMAEIGLILGAWARDTNTLFTAVKGGGMLLFYPVVFYIWPDLPQWIARLGPAFYFLNPIFELAVEDASFTDVAPELAIGIGICLLFVPAVYTMGERLERRLGAGTAVPTGAADKSLVSV